MSKHTKGPWFVSIITKANLTSPGGGIFISAVGKRVARIILSEAEINNRIDEHKANAALMAAAPELLDALQPFILANSSEEFVTLIVRSSDITKARAASAKAAIKLETEL